LTVPLKISANEDPLLASLACVKVGGCERKALADLIVELVVVVLFNAGERHVALGSRASRMA
jgi:hypothetical protein